MTELILTPDRADCKRHYRLRPTKRYREGLEKFKRQQASRQNKRKERRCWGYAQNRIM